MRKEIMNRTERKIDKAVKAATAIALAASCCLLVKACVDVKAKPEPAEPSETVHIAYTDPSKTVYIVYTDENSHPYAIITNPRLMEKVELAFTLTQTERETVARIVAGQAGGKSITCQTMVANVLYNQMLANGIKIDGADYAKCGRGKPNDDTYAAVDAIFTRGEWLLDDTVLWTGDAEHPDEWHRTLRLVTTCDGIAFYEVR